ncbi:hypothetical protein J2W22_002042 [Sphingomonas kyeonggiensis]|nr:hypothetical protein [Sphingomonas kyeonggiensis]
MGKMGEQGRVVRQARNRKTQVIRTGGKRWSHAAERAFLEELAATANVRAAAEAAGFSTTAIYRRRMRWPGFAAAWQACLEQGYARIETQLIALATDSLRSEPVSGAAVATGKAMSVAEAMNLLKLHRASVKGGAPQRYDARARPPDIEAVRASILRKIEAIERAGAGAGKPARAAKRSGRTGEA